ncbi:tyrosine-type recombinase/integrase [Rhodococcus sp. H29-C3]|uniref:tyrosine-type recombinase/integrase n=1 Tax=Rhodococcus sp. H29-C3 TaxID=3046307 RepID=UPI0024B884B8|nr:tyrosine-type recombinase/integrase [Rhodococcus sp. H29-C3]MDJ0363476.1 tyrosine-type recombinase/integrase [Rhodococcus sp. H29-C3]
MSTHALIRKPHVCNTIELLDDYACHVDTLECAEMTKHIRRRQAHTFLDQVTDLEEWMRTPTLDRLTLVRRLDAWTFLSWCFATTRIVPDVEMIAAKGKGAHFSLWSALHRDDINKLSCAAQAFRWNANWMQRIIANAYPLLGLTQAVTLHDITRADLDSVDNEIANSMIVPRIGKTHLTSQNHGLRALCFQLGLIADAPEHPNTRRCTPAERASGVPQPAIREVIAHYLSTVDTILRPKTVISRAESLTGFTCWLAENHPDIAGIPELTRTHIEEFLAYNAHRASRGRGRRGQSISSVHHAHTVIDLRGFFDDIAAWGWQQSARSLLIHRGDIPRKTHPLPRALATDTDRALMAAVADLDDVAARAGITILRGTGLRLGELLDLELNCLWDLPGHGTWLKVPLGKLNTERVVPLDDITLACLDEWMSIRGKARSLPHPRDGRSTDFLFTIRGARIGGSRIRRGLADAIRAADLLGPDGAYLTVTPHQLRHTYATSLVNAGMSLQALMALLGHSRPEMTIRYAHLANSSVHGAYEAAMNRLHATRELPLVIGDKAVIPDRIEWLHSEMIKTRVAHGYCSRHLAAEACPYANICEQCDNFTTTTEFVPQLEQQLSDERVLRDDAHARGWDSEVARHARVVASIQRHLDNLKPDTRVDPGPRAG